MKSILCSASLVALTAGSVATGSAFAQQTTPPPARDSSSWTMPYQAGFWGHVGASYGRSKLHAPCPPGDDCELRDQAWRVFGGGKFNNIFGAEVGFIDLGDFNRGGGKTESRGLDLALIAGFPIGTHSSIFGKLGGTYMRTTVSGSNPGLTTGRETGWGPRVGVGAQIGLTQNWAIRLDADRFRIDLPGSTQNVDTYMLGAQYSFR
jgi:OOP family OmpA-OmpF porin